MMEPLVAQLSHADPVVRHKALAELVDGEPYRPAGKPWVNMHVRSGADNCGGMSPTRLAWETFDEGLYAMGLCDDARVDALPEWWAATELLDIRAAAGFSCRVAWPEYSGQEINLAAAPGKAALLAFGLVPTTLAAAETLLGGMRPDAPPPLAATAAQIRAMSAVPVLPWRDGFSAAEQQPQQLLDRALAQGVAAVSLTPEQNWNVTDPAAKAQRLQRMNEFIVICQKLELPILVGTDMTLPGQPLVDDFDADPMLPHAPEFLSGAQVMLGHTLLVHYAQFGYCSAAAEAEFPVRKARNAFFARVGALRAPNAAMRERLVHAGATAAYTLLRDSAAKGKWLP